jgi:ATP phosphoribosyltransferase regulatory subunit
MVVEALGLPPPLATRLTRAFSNPRKLRAELAAASDGAETIPRGGDRLAAILSSLPEAEARAVLEEIWALAGIEPVGGRTAAEIVHRLGERSAVARAPRLTAAQAQVIGRFLAISGEPAAALDEVAALVGSPSSALDAARQAWARRVDALVDAGTPRARMRLSAAFGRPFGYYDGMVFEVRSAALGDDQPVAAGGRYDGLPERLGANLTTGALGCMVRPGRAWVEGLR